LSAPPTALFNVLDWIGFGLMLIGLLALLGRPVTWREGFLWDWRLCRVVIAASRCRRLPFAGAPASPDPFLGGGGERAHPGEAGRC
jgi:predicted cobalt transporter CbtA